MRALLLTLPLLACVACSTTDQARTVDAATTPLNDLNLVKAEIPEVLRAAQRAPYDWPAELRDCEALARQVHALDAVLGPDLDAPPSVAERGLLERGVDEASGAAVGAVQRTAEGLIPFRGWIRKLSGAERHSKRVSAAITAGGVRRSFLKGASAALGCVR